MCVLCNVDIVNPACVRVVCVRVFAWRNVFLVNHNQIQLNYKLIHIFMSCSTSLTAYRLGFKIVYIAICANNPNRCVVEILIQIYICTYINTHIITTLCQCYTTNCPFPNSMARDYANASKF